MKIREARLKDIDGIRDIANMHQLSRDEPDFKNKKYGLFEYPKTSDELINSLNPYFTVRRTNTGILGYCLSFDCGFMNSNFDLNEHPEWGYLLDAYETCFLYIDQLCVRNPESMGAGRVANLLVDGAISKATDNDLSKVLAYISEDPFYNERSIWFFKRKGFRKDGSVLTHDDIGLGIYRLDL